MRFVFVAVACGLAVAGCAKDFDQASAGSASPSAYQSYTCPQLAEEASLVAADARKAAGIQDYTGDSIALDVGRIVFFPILVFSKGNYAEPAEAARLRGVMEAIEQASIQKNCDIIFQHTPSPPPPPQGPQWRRSK
jgi:hypothetical protein